MSFHAVLAEIQNTAKGAVVLADWLGPGGVPVEQRKADDRAIHCVFGNEGKPCPNNKSPNWWDKVKGSIAAAIRDMLEVKNHAKMEAAYEKDLNMCSACGCCLKLKVWVPIDHVKRVVPKEELTNLPTYCWMRQEIQAE